MFTGRSEPNNPVAITRKKRNSDADPQQPSQGPGQDGCQEREPVQVEPGVTGAGMLAAHEDAYDDKGQDHGRRPGNDKIGQGKGQVVALAEAVGVSRRSEGAQKK